jgi:NAD(P)-dependent dehydrogenase (short-subunit alcohol dehydrogenase family)
MLHHGTLNGKVAFITGAASGIGEAAARCLSEAGAAVALIDQKPKDLGLANSLALAADVSDESAIANAVASTLKKFNRLDIVVANAGINGFWGAIDETSVEDWDKVVAVNLRGAFLTVKHTVPHLRERGGSIIITASVNGTRMFSNTGATAYASTKAAQIAFAKMTALELAKHRIRVNAICPGSIATNIDASTTPSDLEKIREPVQFPAGVVPLKRGHPGHPRDVAQLIWFLASDASSHISGTEIFIDGAQSLLQG